METTVPTRPAQRTHAARRAHEAAPNNNERQLLARIAQIEQGIRLSPAAEKPRYILATSNNASSFGDGPDFGRYHEDSLSGLWAGHEHLTDQQGRRWSRFFKAVIDDFGNLVEVSA